MCFGTRCNKPRLVLFVLFSLKAGLLASPATGQVFSYERSPVTNVIADIEAATPYRFLYRDALVSGVRVSFSAAGDSLVDGLGVALMEQGLRLQVDPHRYMAFVLPLGLPLPDGQLLVRGTVSDARSLERLPHATVSWRGHSGVRGIVADDGGRFLIELASVPSRVLLITSYLGYKPDSLYLRTDATPGDLSVKLQPSVISGSEVVVSSSLLSSNLDSTWFHLLSTPLAAAVGEQSVTRSIQALPAVGLTTAVSSGLNVRGSRTDGFQVLLDGIPIYNQSHLFGMFDAFNPDALQTVDFYYGVAPARFQAPPGGTLSFLTRTGSKNRYRSRLGVTSTSLAATAEGPVGTGRGSWILSGRRSYLDNIDWFNNNRLIAVGLGVGRETSDTRRIPLDERTLISGEPSASFFDLHSKLDYEFSSGATLQFGVYVGGDRTAQDGERVIAIAPQRQNPRVRSTVTTANNWGNVAATAHYRSAVHSWGYTHTYVGVTRYHGSYRKDDFFYRTPQQGSVDPQLLFAPFLNKNSLREARLVHESSIRLSPTLRGATGFSAQRLISRYEELSALRPEFNSDRRAWQFDIFAELSRHWNGFSAMIGLRPHYFSRGRHLRLSPRITLTTTGVGPISASAGYARNYQFAHRLYVQSFAGSDIWIISNEDEGPGGADHLTASLLYRVKSFTAQLEGFLKLQKNLRRHETLVRPGGITDGAVLLAPWTHNNVSRAHGVEALLTHRLPSTALTATYTLSRVQIRHDDVNQGAYFLADWDRLHQFALNGQITLSPFLDASISWNIATGHPDPLADTDEPEQQRYPAYKRLDCSIDYHSTWRKVSLNAFFRLYNILNTHNTWYRTLETVIVGRGQNLHLALEPVDVYDLGFQPSFGLFMSF